MEEEREKESPSSSQPGSARSSHELEIGHRVEDLWGVQEHLLTPSEKLNSCFDSIPVSAFPSDPCPLVVEIPSNSSLDAAVEILSKNKLLSAPVRNVDAPDDATWMDRYIGIVEFAGIAVWLLHKSGAVSVNGSDLSAHSGTSAASLVTSPPTSPIARMQSAKSGIEEIPSTEGSFFQHLTSSELYKNAKVEDISGTFRWAPFLPVQTTDSFLTMLLLLSKYKMKALPVIDMGDAKINNIVTQSAVVHMLAECAGLQWFEKWGTKTLSEVALPLMNSDQLVKIYEEEPVLKAFELMWRRGVGGLPVVDKSGKKAIGNISIRDVQFLLLAPELYKDYRSITAMNFLTAVRKHIEEQQGPSPLLRGVITCKRNDQFKDVILKLDSHKIHRIYVVNDDGDVEGVITLRDIISKLVHEPPGYFGDFFDGVVPLPGNSRV